MALAGGRADVSQLTSLLPLSQLAREAIIASHLSSQMSLLRHLYTEEDQTVPNLALLFNPTGELHVCELVLC